MECLDYQAKSSSTCAFLLIILKSLEHFLDAKYQINQFSTINTVCNNNIPFRLKEPLLKYEGALYKGASQGRPQGLFVNQQCGTLQARHDGRRLYLQTI